jgi:4-methyl-5(b-hydroxyethyl)-thiazole monophosphate biosynthesis
MKKAFIFLANGFEEIEALATVDVLRRAGIEVKTVSITEELQVNGAHGVPVIADSIFANNDYANTDWLILPGGMPGATNLAACKQLTELLTAHHAQGGNIAAICASPAVVLSPLGILEGKEATCYPGFESGMNCKKAGFKPVIVDGNVITANGPGNTIAFALAIITKALCEEKAREVAEGMLIYTPQQNYNF